ncbi:hypothetical protein BDV30DRAFT_157345 [Aspergillus minisclerotigenes]|uniref:Uncharacterized protein n=1 Tax=Aspergillus minisclerotigenes TaxID=656917 RepID=A0A5N6IYA0_9EURO|nr:hypothetical protein BDV30DRAFT_157345 [Aspergillus minisclerotigenes]
MQHGRVAQLFSFDSFGFLHVDVPLFEEPKSIVMLVTFCHLQQTFRLLSPWVSILSFSYFTSLHSLLARYPVFDRLPVPAVSICRVFAPICLLVYLVFPIVPEFPRSNTRMRTRKHYNRFAPGKS